MLIATSYGSYSLPSSAVAVLKPHEDAFKKEMEGLPSTTRSVGELPPELKCPLCKEVMRDSAFASKCCLKSYCDKYTCDRGNEGITDTRLFCIVLRILPFHLSDSRVWFSSNTSSQIRCTENSECLGERISGFIRREDKYESNEENGTKWEAVEVEEKSPSMVASV